MTTYKSLILLKNFNAQPNKNPPEGISVDVGSDYDIYL
uniref:Uncharacterized protein n=1 Tax=Xiphophorus maculatus TaxID=8083 RepID=A0A3B5Q5P7_XIPMA